MAPRKPELLHDLHGRPGHHPEPRPLNPTDPLGDPPSFLSAEAKLEWARVIASAPAGLLTISDSDTVVAFVTAVLIARQAGRQLEREGLTVTDAEGRVARHPVSVSFERTTGLVAKLGSALGLTPSSRLTLAGRAAGAGAAALANLPPQAGSIEEYLAAAPPTSRA